jgi:hypothetical protein
VRVTYLQADFELGNWVGCTRMSWDLTAGDAPAADPVSVERCVRKSNMWGYQTANDVVDDSYAAAMADFLTKLEIASARLPAPAAQPPL